MENNSDHFVHFVLVHGSGHGAWCWYKVATILEASGHSVTAVDLAASGVNPIRLNEINSVFDYIQPLMNLLASLNEKVVLVGHSYGGLPISLAMEKFFDKISLAVFVTAYMPHYISPPASLIHQYFETVSSESLLDTLLTTENGLPSKAVFGPKYLQTVMYKNCSTEDSNLAKTLVRPTGLFIEDFTEEKLLTEGKYGSVDKVFVMCEGDEVMKQEFQQMMIDDYPPRETKVINGAAHMVMFSKPDVLSLTLLDVANKYTNTMQSQ